MSTNKHGKRWSNEEIELALCLYRHFTGDLPTVNYWRETWGKGERPSYQTVIRRYGSWGAALAAAGLPRTRPGEYDRRGRKRGPYQKNTREPVEFR